MSFCPNCGTKVEAEDKFCANCGKLISQGTDRTSLRGENSIIVRSGNGTKEKGRITAQKIKLILLVILVISAFVAGSLLLKDHVTASNIKSNLDLGYKYLNEGKYEEAILAFEKVINIESKSIEARVGLVGAYIKTGKQDEAEKLLKEVININPKKVEPYLELAKLYISENDPVKAIKILTDGYKATNEESIKSMLEDLKSKITVSFDQAAIDKLNPGWQLIKSQVINFPSHDVIVSGIYKEDDVSGRQGKVIVVKYNFTSGSWVSIWSGDIVYNEIGFYEFLSISEIKSDSQKRALALVTTGVGGSTGYGQVLALTIDDKDICNVEEKLEANAISVEQQGNALLVIGTQPFGLHKLSFQGEEYVDSKTPASELSPAGSVKVAFKLDSNGDIVAAQQNTLNMKIGQTIAFVPDDAITKQKFDEGYIGIYTDAWNGILNTGDADRIWSGNSYKFDKSGTVKFLLITEEKEVSNSFLDTTPLPTITINVEP